MQMVLMIPVLLFFCLLLLLKLLLLLWLLLLLLLLALVQFKKNVIYSLSEPVVTMKVITTSFALYRGEGKFMIATSKTDIMCSSGGRFYTHHSNSVNGLKHMS